MMNLVDYGTDSSDNEGEETLHKPASGDDEAWDGENGDSPQTFGRLPGISKKLKQDVQKEGELEDFLKSRKQWEKDLAEEAKSEMNSAKPMPKKRVNAFGELGSLLKRPIIDDTFDEEEEEEDRSVKPTTTHVGNTASSSSDLLKILPQPRKKVVKAKLNSVLLPSSLTPRQVLKRPHPEDAESKASAKLPEKDSDEEDDGPIDFFGLNSATVDLPEVTQPMPSFIPKAQIFEDAPMPGPSRPVSSYQESGNDIPAGSMKQINDEIAQKLIYNSEKQWLGASNDSFAREAVMNIREINVDRELGPNVRETLLKNLNNKAMAHASALSLPSVKKGPQDKLAKQKHQITHLAQLAIAREEELREKWADDKHKRVSTAKKYGFR